MTNFVSSALARMGSREPVRDVIRAHWPKVKAALDNGATNTAIKAQLDADGVKTGKKSGFNSALTIVMAENEYARPSARAKRTATTLSHEAQIEPTLIREARPVTDDRRRMWGDAS